MLELKKVEKIIPSSRKKITEECKSGTNKRADEGESSE
jgi:hypothetical protein